MGLKLTTGCRAMDDALTGGLETGSVTLVYGEAETGKTTLAMQCVAICSSLGMKALYVDAGGGFSPLRFTQIAEAWGASLSRVIVLRVEDFWSQDRLVERMGSMLEGFRLLAFDTVTTLYRAELAGENPFTLNRVLNRQVAELVEQARRLDLAVLLLSQVTSAPGEGEKPVAQRILRYWSDVTVRLSLEDGMRCAYTEKPDLGRRFPYRISRRGIVDVE